MNVIIIFEQGGKVKNINYLQSITRSYGSSPFYDRYFKSRFQKTIPHGFHSKAIGSVHEIHPKKWKVDVEVFANDILCASGEVMAVVMPSTFAKRE